MRIPKRILQLEEILKSEEDKFDDLYNDIKLAISKELEEIKNTENIPPSPRKIIVTDATRKVHSEKVKHISDEKIKSKNKVLQVATALIERSSATDEVWLRLILSQWHRYTHTKKIRENLTNFIKNEDEKIKVKFANLFSFRDKETLLRSTFNQWKIDTKHSIEINKITDNIVKSHDKEMNDFLEKSNSKIAKFAAKFALFNDYTESPENNNLLIKTIFAHWSNYSKIQSIKRHLREDFTRQEKQMAKLTNSWVAFFLSDKKEQLSVQVFFNAWKQYTHQKKKIHLTVATAVEQTAIELESYMSEHSSKLRNFALKMANFDDANFLKSCFIGWKHHVQTAVYIRHTANVIAIEKDEEINKHILENTELANTLKNTINSHKEVENGFNELADYVERSSLLRTYFTNWKIYHTSILSMEVDDMINDKLKEMDRNIDYNVNTESSELLGEIASLREEIKKLKENKITKEKEDYVVLDPINFFNFNVPKLNAREESNRTLNDQHQFSETSSESPSARSVFFQQIDKPIEKPRDENGPIHLSGIGGSSDQITKEYDNYPNSAKSETLKSEEEEIPTSVDERKVSNRTSLITGLNPLIAALKAKQQMVNRQNSNQLSRSLSRLSSMYTSVMDGGSFKETQLKQSDWKPSGINVPSLDAMGVDYALEVTEAGCLGKKKSQWYCFLEKSRYFAIPDPTDQNRFLCYYEAAEQLSVYPERPKGYFTLEEVKSSFFDFNESRIRIINLHKSMGKKKTRVLTELTRDFMTGFIVMTSQLDCIVG